MKKLILSFVLLSLSFVAINAQTDGSHTVYCELMGYNFWGVGKVKVTLDMGKYSNAKGYDSLYSPDGKKMKFNTMMGALNYMGERGWRCINTYYVTVGKSTVLHFLLEKTVTTDEEVTEGLILKEDKESMETEHPEKKTRDDMYK